LCVLKEVKKRTTIGVSLKRDDTLKEHEHVSVVMKQIDTPENSLLHALVSQ